VSEEYETGKSRRDGPLTAQTGLRDESGNKEAHSSGVSWAAVIAGAFVTAALSLVLLALGAGLGLSSVSPWSNVGASASAVGTGTIVWLILNEIIASAMGGYLAGRLRTKWAILHTDEVYFRDTAHGFLVWAVAVVITSSFLAAAGTSMAGGTGTSILSTSGTGSNVGASARTADPNDYFVDTLFRSDRTLSDDAARSEAGRILANALRQKDIPASDKNYLEQMVTARTGLNQSDAEKRVSTVLATAREVLDASRKAAAHLLLWLFIALLIGAFCASYAATIGGRQRDHVRTI
jgi:hypothetical protein